MSIEDKFASLLATIEVFENKLRALQEAPEKVTPQRLEPFVRGTTELRREIPELLDSCAEALKNAAIANQIVRRILTTVDQVDLLAAHHRIDTENDLAN